MKLACTICALRMSIFKSVLIGIFLLHSSWLNAEITITEIVPHQFPDAVASSKTGKFRLTWKNQIKAIRNTQIIGDIHSAGEFLIQSDTSNPITVNMLNVGDVPGVELKTFQFRYKNKTYTSFPITGLDNPGSGETANVGMRILFTKDVNPGDISPSYEIIITEEEPLPVP